jgi:hypothetical protein
MYPALKPLHVMSPDAEPVFRGRVARYTSVYRASSLGELRDVLESLPNNESGPERSLDLLGHSSAGHHLLRLGHTKIDMLDPAVARDFRALVAGDLLLRLRIRALRLLGCETAVSDAGQRTMRMLARTLHMPVYGTLVQLIDSHWGADGFDPAFAHVLVRAGGQEP